MTENTQPTDTPIGESDMTASTTPAPLNEVERLQLQNKEYLDGWQRARADYQNLLKQNEQRQAEMVRWATIDFLQQLLPIHSLLDMALMQAPVEPSVQSFIAGVQHIKKQYEQLLEQYGVTRIASVGLPLNPQEHEAVAQEPSDRPENEIIREVSGGYKFQSNVLVPAKVVVSSEK